MKTAKSLRAEFFILDRTRTNGYLNLNSLKYGNWWLLNKFLKTKFLSFWELWFYFKETAQITSGYIIALFNEL
jgi:hypothetical protein